MWLGSVTLAQVRSLGPVFAVFKGELGWVIPKWLVELKMNVIIRDLETKE